MQKYGMLKFLISLLMIILIMQFSLASFYNVFAESNTEIAQHDETLQKNEEINFYYLSDMEYITTNRWSYAGYGSIMKDKNINGEKISLIIDGSKIIFNKGIGAHASSQLTYDISEYSDEYTRFVAKLGIDSSQNGKGDVWFRISVSNDGIEWKELYKSESITSNQSAYAVDIDISNYKYLRLYADQNGGNGNDHSVFGDARLVKRDYDLNSELYQGVHRLEYYDEILSKNNVDYNYENNLKLVLEREFVSRVGFWAIQDAISKGGEDIVNVINWLKNDSDALELFINSGEIKNGVTWLNALSQLYKNFKSDKSCSIAMNPFTGEVLAMVSTPSYDTNAFIMGMSKKQWDRLNKDKKQPLYNRFRQVWCPGSTFKPVIAAIGLQSEAFTGTDNFGNEGHSWQKDKTWGTYHVTTLHTYSPVILKNALIYSDNIYFAKAALKIGTEEMERSLSMLGFHSSIPFEIMMAESKFSNNKHIQSEVGLADTGYGQGQVLVNPLHLACIYTSFCNDGNVLKPYLLYKENAKAEQWISEAFSKSVSQEVLEGIKSVVNDSHGTGYAIHRKDMILAGKTGTAEIKESQSDTTGTELGWFAVMTPDKKNKKPILIVSMVEDVKGIGGSGYVVKKDKAVLDKWFGKN